MNGFIETVRHLCTLVDKALIVYLIMMGALLFTLWKQREYCLQHPVRYPRAYRVLLDGTLIGNAIVLVIYGVSLVVGLWTLWSLKFFAVHHLSDLLGITSQYFALLNVTAIGGMIMIVVLIAAAFVIFWDSFPLRRTSHE
jgi:hypothetical protein